MSWSNGVQEGSNRSLWIIRKSNGSLVGDMILPPPLVPGQPDAEFVQEIQPLTLDVRQALARVVDSQAGPWKGKISFHNLDEIPLCPACQVPDTTELARR
jgi:hypothetical protein